MTTQNNNDDGDDGSPTTYLLPSGKRGQKHSPPMDVDVAGGGAGLGGNQPNGPTTPGKSNQRHSSGINTTPGTDQSKGTASSTKRSAKKKKQVIPGRFGHEERLGAVSSSLKEKLEGAAVASHTSGVGGTGGQIGGNNMTNMAGQQQGRASAASDGGTPGGVMKKSRNDVDCFDPNLHTGVRTMAWAKLHYGHALAEQSHLLQGGGNNGGGGGIPFLGTPMPALGVKAPNTPSSASRTPANSSNLKRLRSEVPSSDSSNSNGSEGRYNPHNKKEWEKTWAQELALRELMKSADEGGSAPAASLDFEKEVDDAKQKVEVGKMNTAAALGDDGGDDDDDDTEKDAACGKKMGGGDVKLAAARGGRDTEIVGSSSNNINSNDARDTVSPDGSAKTVKSLSTSGKITKRRAAGFVRNEAINSGSTEGQRGMKKEETDGSPTTKSRAKADHKADPKSNKSSVTSSKPSAKNAGGIMGPAYTSEPTAATSVPKPSFTLASNRKKSTGDKKTSTVKGKVKAKTDNNARPPSDTAVAQDVVEVPPSPTTKAHAPSSIDNGRAMSAKRSRRNSNASATKASESNKKSKRVTKDGSPPMTAEDAARLLNAERKAREDDKKMSSGEQQSNKVTAARDDGEGGGGGGEKKKSDGEDDDTKPAAATAFGTSDTIAEDATSRSSNKTSNVAAAVSSDVQPNEHPSGNGTSAENRASRGGNTAFASDELGTGPRSKKPPSFRLMNVLFTPGVSGENSKQNRQSRFQCRRNVMETSSTAPAKASTTAAQGGDVETTYGQEAKNDDMVQVGRSDQTRVLTNVTGTELLAGGASVDTNDAQFTISTANNNNWSAGDVGVPTGGSSVGGTTEAERESAFDTSTVTLGANNQAQLAEDAEAASRVESSTSTADLVALIATMMEITDPEEYAQLENRLTENLANYGKRLREENLGVMSLVHVFGDVLKWQFDLQKESHGKVRLLQAEKAVTVAEIVRLSEDLSIQASSHAEAEAMVQLLGDEITGLSNTLASTLASLAKETELRKEADATIQRLLYEKADAEADNARFPGSLAEKAHRLKEAEAAIQGLEGDKADVEADNVRLTEDLKVCSEYLAEAKATTQAEIARFHLHDASIGASALFGLMVVAPRVWDAILGGETATFRQHLGGIWIFLCLLSAFAMSTFVYITKKGTSDIP